MSGFSPSRRSFLRRGALAFGALYLPRLPVIPPVPAIALGRVTAARINIYSRPFFASPREGSRQRDDLLNLLEEIHSDQGPEYNPRWYRIVEGFVHSGYVQRVDFRLPNQPVISIPESGLLGEVTVPLTQTFYQPGGADWQPLYRLYYGSTHWIHGLVERPDGSLWYRLFDPKNDAQYIVPATDLRAISPIELSPIARDVPAKDKRIVVDIAEQTLTAYEGKRIVLQTSISTGVPSPDLPDGEIPTDTPIGYWRITQKMASRHMGNGRLTADNSAYELPGVPWTMGFHKDGASLHGCYWHDNFGRKMSHGCVNIRSSEALWLFRWSDPVYDPTNWYTNGLGTLVQVK